MTSEIDSDEFELVDSLEVAKHMAAEQKPDLEKIKAWLKPTEYSAPSSEFNRHLSSQAAGTGEWIRETPQFSQWHSSDDHGSIWIKAVPGAGKSVVAASMVHSLALNECVPVIFFFFRQIIETNRTSRSLLRDWMSQLLPSSEMLQVSLWELLQEKRNLEILSTDELWKHLLAGLRVVERAYCVVDALDEMNVDEEFLARLNALGSFRPGHVKVMMTSRPKQYLQRELKNPGVIHVSLEEELVKRDISVFVRQRVADFGRDGVDKETQEFITEMVCKRSQGLFLYARLMLDQIALSTKDKDYSDASIQAIAAELPVGLEEMYNRVLFDHAALTNTHESVQILILQLVTHSARPMRLIEIAKALEANTLIAKTGRDGKEVVRNACGPLLEIMEDEIVQILHHSFTEFLLDTRRIDKATDEAPQFPIIDPITAHRDIAAACLACLQIDAFDAYEGKNEGSITRSRGDWTRRFDFRSVFLEHPLVDYAAGNWPYHAKQYSIEDRGFFDTLQRFCDPQTLHFKAWLEFMSGGGSSAVSMKNASLLHVAAGFGLFTWGKHLIHSGADVDALDSTQNSPLFWASKGGHTEFVDLLIKARAKLDISGDDGWKPLHVAALRNHAGVVKSLLAAGVSQTTDEPREIGLCGGRAIGHTPLEYASQHGHAGTVLEMIPYLKTEELELALCWAAAKGHFRLLSALLENTRLSPDVTSRVTLDSLGPTIIWSETVLMLAVRSLEPKCVRIMLEKGANVQKVSSSYSRDTHNLARSVQVSRGKVGLWGRTALHNLAQADINPKTEVAATEIMDMLLAAGANLEAKDQAGNTPLLLCTGISYHASASSTALNLLLSAGADPRVMDCDGETLLHRACKNQTSTGTASQLIAHKANPGQARSSDGATPLHCIVENFFSPVDHLHLLINHGADLIARDFNGDTPLHYACRANSPAQDQLVDEILRHQVDVNLQNNLGQTCLHLFQCLDYTHNRNCVTVQSIIDAGANLELYDRNGMTVLLNSIAMDYTATTDALLQHPKSASISARTFNGKTTLHLACHARNSVQLVCNLVSHGADPKWTDNDGNTLLHETATRFRRHPEEIELVEKLVELGVPVDARNSRRQTAAHVVAPAYTDNRTTSSCPTRHNFVSVLIRLKARFNVNMQDIDGYTPLHFACAASETQTFALLHAGADLNAKAFNLRTPLHCAARGRQSSIIAMLIHYATETGQQINIDAADVDGMTPLHDASRSGRPESVRLLIDAGANLQQQDKKSKTPLMACADFVIEDKLWSFMRNDTCSTDLIIMDDFRPTCFTQDHHQRSHLDEQTQHYTARIGVVARMLITAGASIDGALNSALEMNCGELVAAIRQETNEWESDKVFTYAEASLTLSIRNAGPILDSCSGYGPVSNTVRFISETDEATMEAMVSRGVDFTKVDRNDSDDGIAIAKIARLGLIEYMSKIISQAKLLDDPGFQRSISTAVRCPHKIRPLLQIACERHLFNMDMVRLLVADGQVDVDAHQYVKEKKNGIDTGKFIAGPTALHVLAKGDSWWHVDAIKYLVCNGAQVDSIDERGVTPLEIASTHSEYSIAAPSGFFRPQCCEMLLQLGADPNRVNPDGWTPLNQAGPDGDIVRILLKHGADVNAGPKGVLMSAIVVGNAETLRIYLENGADCNLPDTSFNSSYRQHMFPKRYPLITASSLGKPKAVEMVKLLLDHGARVDLLVNDSETIIHYLFEHAKASVLRPFLEMPGLDFNIRDNKGRTVFMAACKSRITFEPIFGFPSLADQERLKTEYTPAYRLLREYELRGSFNIDYLAVDNEGKHLIMYLLAHWDDAVVAYFLPIPGVRDLMCKKDNAGFSPLHYALCNHQTRACYQFINDGAADLLEPDPKGDTALHHLCRGHTMAQTQRAIPLMEQYLSLGGSINARNPLGETPLLAHLASGQQDRRDFPETKTTHFDNFPFFISNGADFRAVKNNGETALHIVARRQTSSRLMVNNAHGKVDYNRDLFRRLVELGCDPLVEDGEGRTALDVAAAMGNDGILGLYQRKKEG